ncbi:MAG: rRNA pseudouridine synthase [Firmicutes bacterium]|nr:rRNA pseudouridine synthase [Bacillota bacterium]
MKKMRLDKLLANSGHGSRSEVKTLVKAGRVTVNGAAAAGANMAVHPEQDLIQVDGREVHYQKFYYLMLNKPSGVVSATRDNLHSTVVGLVPPEFSHLDLFPVGRLDRDTEGLLLLTNDGKLAHRLLAPKKHVPKTYYARISGRVGADDVAAFARGIELEDFTTLPAELEILEAGDESRVYVTIYEGKFHQVKRMFAALGKEVRYLKRIAMGGLALDPALAPGKLRELTAEELALLAEWR